MILGHGRISAIVIAIVSSLILISCGNGAYNGDKMVEATVINSWQSGTKKIIQVRLKNNSSLEIDEAYFGGLNPKVGDCVKVWVRTWKDGSMVPFGNRNLASCK